MEENVAKFGERLKELLAMAKKKKNVLEYQEISDFFADMELDADKFERILDFLEANNVDVLRITDNDDDIIPVSYTHLDVYKRQPSNRMVR